MFFYTFTMDLDIPRNQEIRGQLSFRAKHIFSCSTNEPILKRFHSCILGIADDEIKLSQLICVYADVFLYLAIRTLLCCQCYFLSLVLSNNCCVFWRSEQTQFQRASDCLHTLYSEMMFLQGSFLTPPQNLSAKSGSSAI